jgi:hypothetical protein
MHCCCNCTTLTCRCCRGDFGRLGHGDCTDVFVPRVVDFFNGMAVRQVRQGSQQQGSSSSMSA